jgi:DNA-binding GntR family transcriptional regulator
MLHVLLARIRAEYLEMPGLRLTIPQVQRLFGSDRAPCEDALDRLVEQRFLYQHDGVYARVTGGPCIHDSRGMSGRQSARHLTA